MAWAQSRLDPSRTNGLWLPSSGRQAPLPSAHKLCVAWRAAAGSLHWATQPAWVTGPREHRVRERERILTQTPCGAQSVYIVTVGFIKGLVEWEKSHHREDFSLFSKALYFTGSSLFYHVWFLTNKQFSACRHPKIVVELNLNLHCDLEGHMWSSKGPLKYLIICHVHYNIPTGLNTPGSDMSDATASYSNSN